MYLPSVIYWYRFKHKGVSIWILYPKVASLLCTLRTEFIQCSFVPGRTMSTPFLNIVLSNYQGSYFPGQELSGLLHIKAESEVNITNISIFICGTGMINYISENGTNVKNHFKQECYFEDHVCTYDSTDDEVKPFEAGTHSFPFEFKLPDNIPSSFESPQGYVRYSITTRLEGTALPIQSVKTLFTINAIMDLNKTPRIKYPFTVWANRDVCCMCIASGPLSAMLHIPRTGYVPGEFILLSAEINNMEGRPISSVRAKLLQSIKYNRRNGPKKLKRLIVEIARGSIMPYESQVWKEEPLQIPPVAASLLEHCKLIDIWYKLYFLVCPSGGQSIIMKIPITIGTVPLKQNLSCFERGTGDAPLAGDWPLPNNEPCFFGANDVTDSQGDKEIVQPKLFCPQYVTYSVLQDNIELN